MLTSIEDRGFERMTYSTGRIDTVGAVEVSATGKYALAGFGALAAIAVGITWMKRRPMQSSALAEKVPWTPDEISMFQLKHGLPVTGAFDSKTVQVLRREGLYTTVGPAPGGPRTTTPSSTTIPMPTPFKPKGLWNYRKVEDMPEHEGPDFGRPVRVTYAEGASSGQMSVIDTAIVDLYRAESTGGSSFKVVQRLPRAARNELYKVGLVDPKSDNLTAQGLAEARALIDASKRKK